MIALDREDYLAQVFTPMTRVIVKTLVLALGLVAPGCGRRDMGRVEGRVTFQGAPVHDAVVNFHFPNRPMAAGKTDAEGRFVLHTFAKGDGAFQGRCQVFIVPYVEELPAADVWPPPRPVEIDPRPDIPMIYQAPSTSPLTAEVESGRVNTFEFTLEEQPQQRSGRPP